MKAIIHYNGDYEDSIEVEADTIEELTGIVFAECAKRNWDHENCWSEIED